MATTYSTDAMDKHTKEPWKAIFDANNPEGIQWGITDQYGLWICDCFDNANLLADHSSEINARRIAACVNACKGYRTDDLEYVGRWISAGEACDPAELVNVTAQRDELLAALKWLALGEGPEVNVTALIRQYGGVPE